VSMRQIEALVGSKLRARLLHWFYVEEDPDRPTHEREIARRTGIAPGSVHHALKRLEEGELIVREESSRGPQYRAPYGDIRLQPLFTLFRQDSEVVSKLRAALERMPQIAHGCIFGSFARGTTEARNDIDMLVLVEESREIRPEVLNALGKIEESLNCHVDITSMNVKQFRALLTKGDEFALGVVGGQRIALKGMFHSTKKSW
jgi:predicted nucleotidyltransferase